MKWLKKKISDYVWNEIKEQTEEIINVIYKILEKLKDYLDATPTLK